MTPISNAPITMDITIPVIGGGRTRLHIPEHHSRYILNLLESVSTSRSSTPGASSSTGGSAEDAPKRPRTSPETEFIIIYPADFGGDPDGPRSAAVPWMRWQVVQFPTPRFDDEQIAPDLTDLDTADQGWLSSVWEAITGLFG